MTALKKIAFLGGGNMARAMIARMVSADWDPADITVLDRNADKRSALSAQFGVPAQQAPGDWLGSADALVLAVKPQQLSEVMGQCAPFLKKETLIISIAAGVLCKDLFALCSSPRICRAMPNTPVRIGKGVIGLFGSGLKEEDHRFAVRVFASGGELIWVDQEEMLDAVTAISGSGPAYVFFFIEALEKAALAYGFNGAQASRLAVSTFLGASELAKESGQPAEVLRQNVTSKGGTTFEAIKVMEEARVAGILKEAADACKKRAAELGAEFHRKLALQRKE